MKVSKEIQKKMHRLALIEKQAQSLNREINEYFENKGYNIEELRCGDGESLDELDYGNDITDAFVAKMEAGEFEHSRDKQYIRR